MSVCAPKNDKSIIPTLLRLTQVLPNHFDLYHTLGAIYKNSYSHQEAVTYYQKAEKIDPKRLNNLELAECFQRLNKYENAVKYYILAESQHPDNEHLYREWAFCYRELSAFEPCIETYLKADKIKPDNTWYLGNIGWCYQKIDNYTEGLKYHKRCEQLDPQDTWNLDNIGYCHQRLKDYTLAIEYYQKSLNLRNTNDWASSQLGWCYIVLGDFFTAKSYFEQVITMKATMSQYALMNAGHSFLTTGEPSRGFKYYKKSVLKYDNPADFSKEFDEDFEYVGKSGMVSAQDYQHIKMELLHYRERRLAR